jgi:hypothetical protein
MSSPSVVIAGGPGASGAMTRWDVEIVSPAGGQGIPVLRVLDLSGVPRTVAWLVAARLEAGVEPPGTPILLDWDGEVAQALRCGSAEATVIVRGARGEVLERAFGTPDAASGERVRAAVRRALVMSGAGEPPLASQGSRRTE